MNIKRAIISVYDKTNLEDLASFLYRNGVEIICTEGTNKYLQEKGIPTVKMADYIGFPEILGGRVKSIDPKLAGGILAKSNDKKHEEDMINYNIKRIDMVVGNFPTLEEIAKKTKNEETLLENIDIGGYSLLRAAAKNYKDVVALADPKDYQTVIDNLEDCGDVPLQLRRKLALKVFFSTSKYDASIHKIFSELFAAEKFDHEFFEILGNLRYGSNPMQEAILMKFLEKDTFINYLENLTFHKKPTLRMLKDIKLLFHLASLTNNEFLGFAKKGIFVFGYCAPTQEEKKQFIRIIKELKGGIVYSDDPNIIFELKDSKHDGMMTSYNLEQKEEIISFKPMVFKVNKKVLKQEEEYIVDSDLVVKQNFQEISLDLSPSEQLGFEVAKIHKSDTAVYVKNNLICSGNQSCLNREIALNALENTLEKFEVLPKEGTIIFDSPINSEKITDAILNWKVEKVIVPPTLPGYEKYIKILEENGVTLLVTQRRYHRY